MDGTKQVLYSVFREKKSKAYSDKEMKKDESEEEEEEEKKRTQVVGKEKGVEDEKQKGKKGGGGRSVGLREGKDSGRGERKKRVTKGNSMTCQSLSKYGILKDIGPIIVCGVIRALQADGNIKGSETNTNVSYSSTYQYVSHYSLPNP